MKTSAITLMRLAPTLCLLAGLSHLAAADDTVPAMASTGAVATGATIDESVEQIYLRVDPTYVPPEDADPTDAPFKTIQSAVNAALQYLERDLPVRIGLAESVYRESVTIPGHSLGALLVIEGDHARRTIITGSEPMTGGWELVDAEKNIWRHAWNHDWGDFTLDQSWSSSQSKKAPQRLVSESRAASIALSWEAPSPENAEPTACYRVYRQRIGTTEQDYQLVADEIKESTWEDFSVEPATDFENNQYAYYVTAVDKWGKESRPSGIVNSRARDPEGAGYAPYVVRRRELFFSGEHTGPALRMVERPENLYAFGIFGSFYVNDGYLRDSKDGYVLIRLPEEQTPENTPIEAATNLNLGRKDASACLYVVDKPNLVLRNLTLMNSVQDGLRLDCCRNVLIEDVYAIGNRGSGIDINVQRKLQPVSEAVTLRRVRAHSNGASGIAGSRLVNLRIEDCVVNGSNRSSFWSVEQKGRPYTWNRAGLRLSNTHRGALINLEASTNFSHGVWLDYNNRDILIERPLLLSNQGAGLFLQANPGPITVREGAFVRNEVGLLLASAGNGLLEGCTFYDNDQAAIEVMAPAERLVVDWIDQSEQTVRTENWTWRDNVFSGSISRWETPLLRAPYTDWAHFYETLTASRNLWWPSPRGPVARLDGQGVDFRGWQLASGQDTDSLLADPKLSYDQNRHALTFSPDSPVHERGNWPVAELPEDHREQFEAAHPMPEDGAAAPTSVDASVIEFFLNSDEPEAYHKKPQ
jgi:hypothetical protein